MLDVPSDIRVGVPFVCKYTIQNLTLHLAELVSFSESSDQFVFAGMKLQNFKVLPFATHKLVFNILPLTSGRCTLPQVKVLKKTDFKTSEDGKTLMPLDKAFAIRGPCTMQSSNKELVVHVEPNAVW
jgi:Gryzun, putative Golgi trafficking